MCAPLIHFLKVVLETYYENSLGAKQKCKHTFFLGNETSFTYCTIDKKQLLSTCLWYFQLGGYLPQPYSTCAIFTIGGNSTNNFLTHFLSKLYTRSTLDVYTSTVVVRKSPP